MACYTPLRHGRSLTTLYMLNTLILSNVCEVMLTFATELLSESYVVFRVWCTITIGHG